MSFLFGGKSKDPVMPPPAPQVDDAIAKRRREDSSLARLGRASTVLTSEGGLPDLGSVSRLATSSAR